MAESDLSRCFNESIRRNHMSKVTYETTNQTRRAVGICSHSLIIYFTLKLWIIGYTFDYLLARQIWLFYELKKTITALFRDLPDQYTKYKRIGKLPFTI